MDAQPEYEKVAYRTQSDNYTGPGSAKIESKKINRKPPLKGEKLVEAKRLAQRLETKRK